MLRSLALLPLPSDVMLPVRRQANQRGKVAAPQGDGMVGVGAGSGSGDNVPKKKVWRGRGGPVCKTF